MSTGDILQSIAAGNSAQEDRLRAAKKTGAARALGIIGLNLFSPFKPKAPPLPADNTDAVLKQSRLNQELSGLMAKVKLADVSKAVNRRVSQFNAFAARRGTLPQTVINLYLSKIVEPLSDTRDYLNVRQAYDDYLGSLQELSYIQNVRNEYDNALYQMRRANDKFNNNLLYTVFGMGMDNFMPWPKF